MVHRSGARAPLSALLLLVASSFGCALAPEASTSEETASASSPMLNASLVANDREDAEMIVRLEMGNMSCTGTLVNQDWVLTAAHCVALFGDDGVFVVPHASTTNGSRSDRVIPYPTFVVGGDAASVQDDIALVHLATPIRLPNNPNFELDLYEGGINSASNGGAPLHCFGWGRSTANDGRPGALLDLREGWFSVLAITRDGYKLAQGPGGEQIAPGDSGGPCFFEAQGRRYLTGVHSTVTFQGPTFHYASDQGVDNFVFWIRQTTRRTVNLALGRAATQSSVALGGVAARAVDGNSNGDWNGNSVTHTNADMRAWWEVDLGAIGRIENIVLANRTDCCKERLNGFDVLVSDVPFVSTDLATARAAPGVFSHNVLTLLMPPGSHIPSIPIPTSYTIPVSRSGRYVRVQLNGQGYLSLAEVSVLGQRNEALGRPATQSTTALGASASRAVDGNIDGNFAAGSVTHTELEAIPYWQVDLGAGITEIESIELRNRTDCCSERLGWPTVYVSASPFVRDASGKVTGNVWKYEWNNVAEEKMVIGVHRAGARYVMVDLARTGPQYLSLAEVLVYANRQ